MPFDRIQARKRVNGARVAYGSGIHSQFIRLLADDLEGALLLIDTAGTETQRAQNEVARLGRELDEEKTHYRKLRELTTHTETMVTRLREIAQSPKGAQKKAAELLVAIGAVEVKPPEKIVVP